MQAQPSDDHQPASKNSPFILETKVISGQVAKRSDDVSEIQDLYQQRLGLRRGSGYVLKSLK